MHCSASNDSHFSFNDCLLYVSCTFIYQRYSLLASHSTQFDTDFMMPTDYFFIKTLYC